MNPRESEPEENPAATRGGGEETRAELGLSAPGSGMTDEEAERMAEEMKAKWWAESQLRFLPTDPR